MSSVVPVSTSADGVGQKIDKPFKGLAQYRRDDPCPLFARDKDVELIESRLWSSRVTVMFAGSGVGKTSFLNARLIPALEAIYGPEHVAAPDPHSWARLDPRKELANAKAKVSQGRVTRRGGIIILDQFEELFQHFPSPTLLREFGEELAAVIDEESPLNIRLLISIREEFLADLTSLDDFLPSVLTNYYRLRRLSTREAKYIIENTALLGGASTSDQVDQLVKDLCALDRGQRSDAAVFVDPPYLQIVCQRVWNREHPDEQKPFLSTYKKGDAEHELEAYCRDKLTPLSGRQAVLVRRALEHLTGPHEAKKFRRVSELADEIGIKDPQKLAAALDVLQQDDVKILRRWEESPGSAWATKHPGKPRQVYQLYHDMYAPELWRWKQERARIEWRWSVGKWVAIAAAAVFFLFWPLTQRLMMARAINLPYGHADEYTAVLDMRNAFARTVLFRYFGDRSWWSYTHKLATLSALKNETDAAIGYQLAGLAGTARTAPDNTAGFGTGQYLLGALGGQRGIVDAAMRVEGDKTRVVLATVAGQIVEWSPGNDPVAWTLSAPQETQADPVPANGLQPSQFAFAPRVLCLSPDGKRALTAKVSSQSGPEIQLTAVDLGKRAIVATAVFPIPSPALPGVAKGKESVGAALALGQTFTDLRATSDASGDRFAVVAAGVGIVFDATAGKTTTIPQPGLNQMAFTNAGVVVTSPEEPQYRWRISFWTLSDGKAIPVPMRTSPMLRWDGRLLVRDGTHVLAAKDREWAWVSPDEATPQVLPFEVLPDPRRGEGFAADYELSTFVPRAFDGRRKMFLHTNARGRLAFSYLDDQPEQYAILPISERRSDAPLSHVVTAASLGRFGDGQLVTIDDFDTSARAWNIPARFPVKVAVPKASAAGGAPPPSPDEREEPLTCGSKGGAFCSPDRQWIATVSRDGGKYVVRVAPATPAPDKEWSTAVALEPKAVRVSSSGERIIADHDSGFTYADKGDREHPVRVNTAVKQVFFGPGVDRITLLRHDNYLEVRERSGMSDHEWQVPAATSELTLVAKPDESSVLLFSRTWLHRLRPPNGMAKFMANRFRKGQVWPDVDSVQTDAPIDITQFRESGGDLVLAQAGQPVNERSRQLGATIAPGTWSLEQLWRTRTITVDPCRGDAKRTGGWREKLCDWERTSGRRTGDGLSR